MLARILRPRRLLLALGLGVRRGPLAPPGLPGGGGLACGSGSAVACGCSAWPNVGITQSALLVGRSGLGISFGRCARLRGGSEGLVLAPLHVERQLAPLVEDLLRGPATAEEDRRSLLLERAAARVLPLQVLHVLSRSQPLNERRLQLLQRPVLRHVHPQRSRPQVQRVLLARVRRRPLRRAGRRSRARRRSAPSEAAQPLLDLE
mmetsp:Transcript_25607/g.74001  ORF Transcript_25607/g.74001 Transcript_25607/m.74001 type:complete len:205 (+) Transcript_25607:97-711(+)